MNNFKLDNHPKIESGFKIPDNYFASLSDNINQKLIAESNQPKVISFYHRQKKTIFAMAAILVVALSVPFFMQTPTKISDVNGVAFEDYISYNTKMTPYEIGEYLDEDDIENLKVDFEIPIDILEESLLDNLNVEHYSTN